MADFQHRQRIAVPPDRVYAFVSDVGNLPKYVPTTKSAQLVPGGKVRGQGEATATATTATATFGPTTPPAASSGAPRSATIPGSSTSTTPARARPT